MSSWCSYSTTPWEPIVWLWSLKKAGWSSKSSEGTVSIVSVLCRVPVFSCTHTLKRVVVWGQQATHFLLEAGLSEVASYCPSHSSLSVQTAVLVLVAFQPSCPEQPTTYSLLSASLSHQLEVNMSTATIMPRVRLT